MSEATNRLLLDTHALLWYLHGDPRLPASACARIEDAGPGVVVSVASLWEVAIKAQLGKLALGRPYEEFVSKFVLDADVAVLGLEVPHIVRYSSLPLHHRDPFDRLLIAQAASEGVPVLTRDPAFAAYEVEVLWD